MNLAPDTLQLWETTATSIQVWHTASFAKNLFLNIAKKLMQSRVRFSSISSCYGFEDIFSLKGECLPWPSEIITGPTLSFYGGKPHLTQEM
jgi:hypothetical protein